MRRNGLPCRAIVDRSGDHFVKVSGATTTAYISQVLQLRIAALRQLASE